MGYVISFKAKLQDAEKWVNIGAELNFTSNTSIMIKEVCGSYPSEWNNIKCSEMIDVLYKGINRLKDSPNKYKKYEPRNGYGTVESTIEFLERIKTNCELYPYAKIEAF
jgi:hypothetical protein